MKTTAEIDLKKIFLTPPDTLREKLTLLGVMLAVFLICFGPLCFSALFPARAIFLACLPALSISWGWIVLLRSLFRRSEFCRFSKD